MSKPLSLPGIARSARVGGCPTSARVSRFVCASPFRRHARRPSFAAHQAGLALGVGVDGQAGQQRRLPSSATFASRLAFSASSRSGLTLLRCQAMRADHPKETIGHGHAFQVGLISGGTGQVQQVGQREVAHVAESQDLAPHRVDPAQTVHTTDFVARHPEPVAREGRARQVGLHRGRQLQAHGIRAVRGLGMGWFSGRCSTRKSRIAVSASHSREIRFCGRDLFSCSGLSDVVVPKGCFFRASPAARYCGRPLTDGDP